MVLVAPSRPGELLRLAESRRSPSPGAEVPPPRTTLDAVGRTEQHDRLTGRHRRWGSAIGSWRLAPAVSTVAGRTLAVGRALHGHPVPGERSASGPSHLFERDAVADEPFGGPTVTVRARDVDVEHEPAVRSPARPRPRRWPIVTSSTASVRPTMRPSTSRISAGATPSARPGTRPGPGA